MQLDAYIREQKLTDEGFAKLLGPSVSEWAVRKWRYGQRIPRFIMQKRILAVTAGAVTPSDLVEAVAESGRRRDCPAAGPALVSAETSARA